SLELEHLVAQRITIHALNKPCSITLTASIDGTQTNVGGTNHFATLEAYRNHRISLMGVTGQSKYGVAVMSSLIPSVPVSRLRPEANPRQPAIALQFTLQPNTSATFDKFSAIHTTRDSADTLAACGQTLDIAEKRGWVSLLGGHVAEWDQYWHDCDIL